MKKSLLFLLICSTVISKVSSDDAHHALLFSHVSSASKMYEDCVDLCMDIWTELDLIGAIRTSTEDLMYFASQLVEKFLSLEQSLKLIHKIHTQVPYCHDEIERVNDVARQIDSRFYDIFDAVSSKEVVCCSVLMERCIYLLEDFYSTSPT